MFTIRETALFQKQVQSVLDENERLELFTFIAQYPFYGELVKNSGGMRKLRWQSSGKGKRGGARVIYFNQLEEGIIEMIMIYEKKNRANILGEQLIKIRG